MHKEGLEFLKEALSQTHQDGDIYGDQENIINVNVRHSAMHIENGNEFTLDCPIEDIEILTYKEVSDDRGGWDGSDDTYLIYRTPHSIALVTLHHWWGPTFSGNQWTVDIHPSLDWDKFDKLCLTDEIREHLIDFMAEIILLRDINEESL